MKTWAVGQAIVLACACAGAATVRAGTVSLNFTGEGDGASVAVNYNDDYNNHSLFSHNGFTGVYQWTPVSGASNLTGYSSGTINTFCIQLGQSFSGPSTYNVVSLNPAPAGGYDAGFIDSTSAGQIQLLTDRYLGVVGGTYKPASTTYTRDEVAAAFQLSIWEIEYDGGNDNNTTTANPSGHATHANTALDTFRTSTATATQNYFTTGNFTATSSDTNITTLANYFLNNFAIGTNGVSTVLSQALESPNGGATGQLQDQLWGVPHAVPLPAALPAGMALLAGLGVWRKVKRRRES